MFQNTYFMPCDSETLFGYTQKNLISVFIQADILGLKSTLEKFIVDLSFILNTTLHEHLKHYM